MDNYWSRRALSRRRFAGSSAAALLGAATLAAAGCGDDDGKQQASTAPASPAAAPARGGVFRYAEAAVYDSVDVHRAIADPTERLANLVMSKLVQYRDPDTGVIEPDLAEKYEVPDAATYTFTLRKGAKFANVAPANGREITSDDVKWHFERQASGVTKDGQKADYRFAQQVKVLAKIETPDASTVKLTLRGPDGSWIDFLAAFTACIPNREATEKFEADHRTLNEGAMVGTGPFILKQFRASKDVVAVRNPDYFRKDQPLLDGVIAASIYEDPIAQRTAFEQKQLDDFSNPDPSIVRAVIKDHKAEMFEFLAGSGNTVVLVLNMNRQFKDVRLVRAMNLAVDRRQLIQVFSQGLGQVSGPVPWVQEAYAMKADELNRAPGYRTDRDTEKREARELWAAGGGPALGEVDIKVPDTWLGRWPDTQQIIARMLNDALGVTQFKSTKTSYTEEIIPGLFRGEFPNFFGWYSEVKGPNPRADMRALYFSQSPTNWNRVKDDRLDAAVTAFQGETDTTKAVAKTLDAQRVLLENGQYGVINLYNYINSNARWNYLKGMLKTPATAAQAALGYNTFSRNLWARDFWLDQKDASFKGRPPVTA